MDTVDWPKLLSLPKWCPLSEAALRVRCVEAPLFQITADCFLTLNDHNLAQNSSFGSPFITSVLWAQSLGAAQRVINSKIELDELRDALPPSEFLPVGRSACYGDLVVAFESDGFDRRLLETASYRGKDGLFIVRTIAAHPFTYYFRCREHDDSEAPFAVGFSLIGK